MASTPRIYLFGDFTVSFEEDLRQLLHVKSDPMLRSFFERVAFALREEISQLPSQKQSFFPRFTTLVDILPNLEGKRGASALRFALLCVCHIGLFIRSHSGSSKSYPEANTSCLLGICTGSFAASAIGASNSISELLVSGVEATLVAFRTALLSLQCQTDLSMDVSEQSKPWSALVGLKEADAIDLIESFSTSLALNHVSRPYISAVSPTNVTISAPSAILRKFLASSARYQSRMLPIDSPYHAPHLFASTVRNVAVRKFHDPALKAYQMRVPVIGSTGDFLEAVSFEDALREVVTQTLRFQVRWDRVAESCLQILQEIGSTECEILPVLSNAHQLLSDSISAQSKLKCTISDTLKSSCTTKIPRSTGKFEHSKIALVGFSGRYPDAASNDEFWQLLRDGRDVHRTIPEDRFDWKAHHDPTGKTRNTSRVQYGCFIKEPGVFDTRFFSMSPREAESTDPAQRLLIMSTYEALEMAGFVPNRTPSSQVDRVGVFMGTTSDDWREVNSGQNVDTYFIPGGNRAFVPGRISYFFKFSGPSLSIDTACSSSFSAIHTACSYLWKGDCDTAIAGGTNILTNPDNFAGLDRGHFLSTTGNCNAFDDGANGYCRADAIGSIILKRYEDAIADQDPIFGVIAGAHTNHCGSAESITRPHEGDQASVFNRILRTANQNPLEVGYVEMHGTGTQAGDATEMNSVLSCFVPGKQRKPHHPLYLGSAKANIGHAESASGVSSLIKVLLMMKNNEIPPHCGIKTKINRNYPLDLQDRNVNIAKVSTPWLRENSMNGKRVAFLNNFSAAGGNTAILLEDGPIRGQTESQADPRSTFPVAITAKSSKALQGNMEMLLRFLESGSNVSLPSLSYTTTARRIHHNFRAMVSGTDIKSITSSLRGLLSNLSPKPIPNATLSPKIAFVFTGQGAMYTGIGRELYETIDSFRSNIIRFDSIAQQLGFPSFLPVIDGSVTDNEVEQPSIAHVAHSCVQMALCDLWETWGVSSSLVIGHSLGEYAALYAAKVTSAADTIYLVGTRATLLSQCCSPGSHSMVAVKTPESEIRELVRRSACEIACLNQPDGTVLSGPRQDIDTLTEKLEARGLKCIKLGIPYAFHSAQVDPILTEFEILARSVCFSKPAIPFSSPLLGSVVTEEGVLNASYLSKACRNTVNFQGALEAATASSVVNDKTIWLELGPHPLCSGMIKGTLSSNAITVPSLQKRTTAWIPIVAAVETFYTRGIDIRWNEYHRSFPGCHSVVDLPQYSWDLKNYWIPYRNNFCLTKGASGDTKPVENRSNPEPASILTPSVQRIIKSKDASDFVTESDINHQALRSVIQGHKVNDTALCPSSLYADMAMTAAAQILKTEGISAESSCLDVAKMQVQKPLIANGLTQLLRVSASTDWSTQTISMKFYSVNAEGKKLVDHASCLVKITNGMPWTTEWKRMSFLVKHRLDSLEKSVDNGVAHKMKRGIVYKLFSSFVDYSQDYRGMEEVILDSSELEAVSKVRFQVDDQGFDLNPQWIDSLGHLAGFIMNGNDADISKDLVFVNHGWDGMKISSKLSQSKVYRAYNKMQLIDDNNTYVGNTYVLDGDEIVAVFEGVKFQGIPRRILDQLLPRAKTAQTAAVKPVTKPVAVPKGQVRSTKVEKPRVVQEKNFSRIEAKTSATLSKSTEAARLLKIISVEAGVEVAELKDDTSFDECGVDSLLSLNISSAIQEELNIEVSSSIFVECATVGQLLKRLVHVPVANQELPPLSGSTTPSSTESDTLFEDSASSSATSQSDIDEMPEKPANNTMEVIKAVISEEVGIEVSEILSSAGFDELGIDSLLSLNIMSKLEEVLDQELSKSLLVENSNLNEIEVSLGLKPKTTTSNKKMKRTQDMSVMQISESIRESPRATSHLLQGNAKTASKTLFLFPDGSGSAFSYATLSRISSSVAVYGLSCPWMKDPWAMAKSKVDFCALSDKFLQEIRRVQPEGPYYFGGWSAGGISAYEAAQQLSSSGSEVASLVLIDSPNPIGLENPPQRMYDFFDQLDFFGMQGKKPPKWLRPHFDAFLTTLDDYKVKPWTGKKPLQTHIIYAKDGVCKNLKPNQPRPEIKPGDPREMIWLLNDRVDFSGAGWQQLIGKDNLTVGVVEDVNHFSLVAEGPKGKDLAAFIKTAMGE